MTLNVGPLFMAALRSRSRCGHYIFILWFLLLFLFPRLISEVGDWMSTILPHIVWPKCKFRMQVWNVLCVARWKYRTQNIAKKSASGHHPTTCRAMSSQLRHVSTIRKKNLLSCNIFSTCPHNMVNGPLAAEIVSLVWSTPANFNGTGFASWQRYCTAL